MDAYQSIFAALGDSTRRDVLDGLRQGPRAVGDLARDLPVSRPAVSQHLKVLENAGLVAGRRDGRRTLYRLEPDGLVALQRWLEGFWDGVLGAFAEVANERTHHER